MISMYDEQVIKWRGKKLKSYHISGTATDVTQDTMGNEDIQLLCQQDNADDDHRKPDEDFAHLFY